MENKKRIFLACVKDAVADIFYYNRKEDEDLSRDDVQQLIDSGTVSLAELMMAFHEEILRNYPQIQP